MTFNFFPLKEKTAKAISPKKQKQAKKRNPPIRPKTLFKLLKSFKVTQFRLEVDTGNCILNAKLFPVMALLNYFKQGFNVNFENRNTLVLQIQNRPIYIIKSFINS